MSKGNDDAGAEPGLYELERRQVFSQSLLWDLQRQGYTDRGIEAWRQGGVPHYVTSNPTVAGAYAETVFALFKDRRRLAPGGGPLYICELGAGSGRLAFHFLSRLARLCETAGVPLESFRYVLTDMVQSNLDFFRRHPRFQGFFERGVLDVALFDVVRSDRIALELSGGTIAPGDLDQPLIVIANYLFDVVPQDLFYIHDGRLHRCLVSLSVDQDPRTLDAVGLLAHATCRLDYEPLTDAPYPEPTLQRLLRDYEHALTNTHLLFPAASLRCIERLKALSQRGLMLLSADKGDHRLSSLEGWDTPLLVLDGGQFSLHVNFHAFKAYCEQSGGVALFPNSRYQSVNVGCLLMLGGAAEHTETKQAYQRHIQDFGPDDFFTITKYARKHVEEMTIQEVLAYVRLSQYDSRQFMACVPRLAVLVRDLDVEEHASLVNAIDRVWDLYFPLGEEPDLAYEAGLLLFDLKEHARALLYFERSLEIYGPHTGTLYNMAACYHAMGHHDQASYLLQKVLDYDPANEPAKALLARQSA
jgi:tetratricopeptide (TPR) repeat protein